MNPSGLLRWTPEADAELVRLWNDGASSSQVAAALNVSRSAVAGRVDRLRRRGIELRTTTRRAKGGEPVLTRKASTARKRSIEDAGKPRPPADSRVDRDREPDEPKPLKTMPLPPDFPPSECCQFMHGEVRDGSARWCGHRTIGEPSTLLTRSYCDFHAGLVTAQPRGELREAAE